MPVLPDLISMLTAARSRNIRFHLVIQSYSQMIEKYGLNASQTVLDNCGNLIYLHSREMSFLKYISELAGCWIFSHGSPGRNGRPFLLWFPLVSPFTEPVRRSDHRGRE